MKATTRVPHGPSLGGNTQHEELGKGGMGTGSITDVSFGFSKFLL